MEHYDVAVIGAGPAGLSAALILTRAMRRVVIIDSGAPRNYAARSVNGFLGAEQISPGRLREIGRRQTELYGAELVTEKATSVRHINFGFETGFQIITETGSQFLSRKILFATGVRDVLPELPGISDFYGASVHHCPYCDGWEHRGKKLAAVGEGDSAAGLALLLRGWSSDVTAFTLSGELSEHYRERLARNGIKVTAEKITALIGRSGQLERVQFESGEEISCEAIFFNTDQVQRSELPVMLGCRERKGHVRTGSKQETGVDGVFMAGDADGDVQFAIVAASEGATAAVAINKELQKEEM